MYTLLLGQLKYSINPELIHHIVSIVNQAYDDSEGDLLGPDHKRTHFKDITDTVERGELYAATTDPNLLVDTFTTTTTITNYGPASTILGVFKVRLIDSNIASLGMIVVAPSYQRTKLGQLMLSHFEMVAKRMGRSIGQMEVPFPIDGKPHYFKDYLRNWYTKNGYREVRRERAEEILMGNGAILARPMEFFILQKAL